MRRSLAGNVREAARRAGEFRVEDLAEAMGVLTYNGRVRIRRSLQDFIKRGEIARVSRGLFKYVDAKKVRTKMDVVWHLVRSHRQFTTDEIERLSGAARYTVREYLLCLRDLGFLRKVGLQGWRLVADPGPETPVNVAKCERLARRRREAKRAASRPSSASSLLRRVDKGAKARRGK